MLIFNRGLLAKGQVEPIATTGTKLIGTKMLQFFKSGSKITVQ